MTDLAPPQERVNIVGREALEAELRGLIDAGSLTNGWMLTGPRGSGKASLAFRLARALLDPAALTGEGLRMPAAARGFRLAASGAHPDLFVAARRYDEKKGAYQTEIAVDTIRQLTEFLSKTAAFGGWRVAIVDAADDLNRQAANALLKSLEEPPARATLLLVAHAPGRLLPTIRSRCRRVELRPLDDETVAALLRDEAGLAGEKAARVARAARGRPGYALSLAAGDGAAALESVDAFLSGAAKNGDVSAAAASLVGKQAAGRWEIFRAFLLESLSDAARAKAAGEAMEGPLARFDALALAEAHEKLGALIRRGEGVNLDRRDLILALGRALRDAAPRAA